MAFIRQYQAQARGDPALPFGLIAGRIGGRLLRGAARFAGRALRRGRQVLTRPTTRQARAVAGTAAAAAAAEAARRAGVRQGARRVERGMAEDALALPRRRMNVANVKALRRAMRRVQGFAKLASRTISFTRRVKMKKRRRA